MSPEQYPRRILLCSLGRTPQTVTEAAYALACERTPPFLPTEIHLLATAAGREVARRTLMGPESQLTRLCAEHGLPPIRLDEECIHLIGGTQAIPDIRSPQDNVATADAALALLRTLTSDEDSAICVSLAGGRKTMSYYLGYAISLFGRAQDRLAHVLVSEPFESHAEFFYPPRQPTMLGLRDGTRVSTAQARVELAEIPFVHIRAGMPQKLFDGAASFQAAVDAANAELRPPRLEIDENKGTVRCGSHWVDLPPQVFAVYAWMASRCQRYGPSGAIAVTEFRAAPSSPLHDFVEWLERFGEMHPYRDLIAELLNPRNDPEQWFREKVSQANRLIEQKLGVVGLDRYGIDFTSKVRSTRRRSLKLHPSAIGIVGRSDFPQ